MAKNQGRFLLTWNAQKHPEVAAFFNQVEKGMAAHELRELITNYMKYKQGGDSHIMTSGDDNKGDFFEKDTNSKKSNSEEYRDFDPFDL